MLKPLSHTSAALSAFAVALYLCASAAVYADAAPASFDAKTLRKAARLVERLRRLDAAASSSDHTRADRSLVRKFYPALHSETSALPEGDLKTELSTAAFDYEDALDGSSQTPSADAPSGAQSLRAKALRHVARAEALIRYAAGDRSATTLADVSELETERARNLALAAHALSALKSLDAHVKLHTSRARLEEDGGAVARVSYARMADDFKRVEATVRRVLRALPRSPLYYHLQHALNSYRDGLFWWRKTQPGALLVVHVNELSAPDPLDALGIAPEVVNYTVVGNWKSAHRYILKAETEMAKMQAHTRPAD
ncbi:MAG TPA: hypothetical protein VGV59_19570 [Pyrinomonadaceae bacterium]|nr:hypothetical protein [Pyrinomonadaceae bacterium]